MRPKSRKSTPRFIVLTGGPGAGKTAVIEIARKTFCRQVLALPEAAGILFGGGFWRRQSDPAKRCAQRAIFHVQRELERLAAEETEAPVLLCDRGTLDGVAYWPGRPGEFFRDVGTSRKAELARYSMVIHLCTPTVEKGYNHANPLRTESALEAAQIDERILRAWAGHPNRHVLEGVANFPDKVDQALRLIQEAASRSGA